MATTMPRVRFSHDVDSPRTYNWNFSEADEFTATPPPAIVSAAIDAVTGLTITGVAIDPATGQIVSAQVSGGTAGVSYLTRCLATLSDGTTTLILPVAFDCYSSRAA